MSFKTLLRRAGAAAATLAACTGLAAAAPAPAPPPAKTIAQPALWVIKDADSTIYLFGSIHVLRPSLDWHSPKVAKALAESADVTLEISNADDPTVAQPLIQSLGLDPAHPLSGKLPAAEQARLQSALKGLGLPPERIEPMRPWLVGLTLGMAPLRQAGYDPASGVELQLSAEAKRAGKPLAGFETIEQQMRFFADLPPKAEVAFLSASLDTVQDGPPALDRMVSSWSAGDVAGLEREFVTEMNARYPQLYDLLIRRRNEDWARQLKAKLAGSGVSFVAVGAGHLVGPDSVQAQLAKLGIKAERL